VPDLRPFRALRFEPTAHDLSAVLAPPYDIISPQQRRDLLERDPHNVVRIELPADLGAAEPGDYAAAAELAAVWRESGVLVRDEEPTVTVHEMRWTGHDGRAQTATGLFCQLRLEPYRSGGGVLPHERTHGGPKADRYALLDAVRINTSPIVFLAGSEPAPTSSALLALSERTPDATAVTPDGVGHRVWVCPAAEAMPVLGLMSTAPLTIADGHHRYETALRFRDDHQAELAGDEPPELDYVLALIYPLDQSPPALPTHRVVRGRPCGEDLVERLQPFGSVERLPDVETLLTRMAEPAAFAVEATGTGRIGLLTRDLAVLVRVDEAAVAAHLEPGLSAASRGLDVNALGVMLAHAFGADATEMAGDGRLWYEKDAAAATRQVAREEASAAFLLDEMPASAISLVAEAGEVMPQKSTYFDPKAPTGIVLSPLQR
jgi:uncharacterized protein (DUF1015 family)